MRPISLASSPIYKLQPKPVLLPKFRSFCAKYERLLIFLTTKATFVHKSHYEQVLCILYNYHRKHHAHEILELNTRISRRKTQVLNTITVLKITNGDPLRPMKSLKIISLNHIWGGIPKQTSSKLHLESTRCRQVSN